MKSIPIELKAENSSGEQTLHLTADKGEFWLTLTGRHDKNPIQIDFDTMSHADMEDLRCAIDILINSHSARNTDQDRQHCLVNTQQYGDPPMASEEIDKLVEEIKQLPEPDLERLGKRNRELAKDPRFKKIMADRMKYKSDNSFRKHTKNNNSLIFLDIDGVLNHLEHFKRMEKGSKTMEEYDLKMIDRDIVKLLNDLCEQTNSVVVISATMRKLRSLEYLKDFFKKVGATFEIIDTTPVFNESYAVRGNEIYHWLKENSKKHFDIDYWKFKRYAIIDDDSDMLLWQKDNFFKTNGQIGLTEEICNEIKEFLKSKN